MQGVELRHQPERSSVYLGSPSVIRLADGTLVASHDYFGGYGRDDRDLRISEIYRSEDNGATWDNIQHFAGAFWGTLFENQGALYHISIEREYGSIVIRRSIDGAWHWSSPADSRSGRLREGGAGLLPPNWHFGGATPVLSWNGRIYKAVENMVSKMPIYSWHAGAFHAAVISAPVDADLLDAANWTVSNEIAFDHVGMEKAHPGWSDPVHSGFLEGNIVVAPDGHLRSIMRCHLKCSNKAALLNLSDDGRRLSFDGETGIIDFPGGASKFTVRRDPVSGLFFTFSNPVRTPEYPQARNILTFSVSKDLRHWLEVADVLTDDSDLTAEESVKLTGFQYVDWQFDGDDILYLTRTACDGANSYHNSNRITFHILKNFRSSAKAKLAHSADSSSMM